MMEWLKDKGCFCNESTFTSAVFHDNLQGMRWLKANECPCNEMTFSMAAKVGSIEMIEWLRVNECPMAKIIPVKDRMGDETIVNWFTTNGYLIVAGQGFYKL